MGEKVGIGWRSVADFVQKSAIGSIVKVSDWRTVGMGNAKPQKVEDPVTCKTSHAIDSLGQQIGNNRVTRAIQF